MPSKVSSPPTRAARRRALALGALFAGSVGAAVALSNGGRHPGDGSDAGEPGVPSPVVQVGARRIVAWPASARGLVAAERALALAAQAKRAGAAEDAGRLLEQAVSACPTHKRARYELGLELMRRQRLADAVIELEAALSIDPTYVAPHDDLALCHWHQGDAARAWATWAQGARTDDALVTFAFDPFLGLRTLEAAVLEMRDRARRAPDDPIAQYRYTAALSHLDDLAPARQALTSLLQRAGDQPVVHLLAAHLAQRAGDDRAKVEHLEHAVTLDPECASAWVLLAEARLAAGSTSAGLEAARRAHGLRPDWGRPCVLAAVALLAADGPEEEAIALLDAALVANPESLFALYGVGSWAWKALGGGEGGALRTLLLLCLGSSRYAHEGGELTLRGTDPAKVGELRRAVGSSRSRWAALHHAWLLQRGWSPDPVAAVLTFTELLEQGPSARARNNLGALLLDSQRPGPALVHLEEATRLAPDMTWPHHNRGLALLELGRDAEALAAFCRALVLEPTYVEARRSRLVALERLGETAWLAAEREALER